MSQSEIKHLLNIDDYKNSNLYILRKIRGDKLIFREIIKEDVVFVKNYSVGRVFERDFLLARCIKKINEINRVDLRKKEWWRFIKLLNLYDKVGYMSVIRKRTYLEKEKDFNLYF